MTKPFETTRQELEQLAGTNITEAILVLQGLLGDNSEKKTIVIVMLGRLKGADEAIMLFRITQEDLQKEYEEVRISFLAMLRNLQASDLEVVATVAPVETGETPAAAPAVENKPVTRQGNLLYRIPPVMPVGKETKCLVRIAVDEKVIEDNISKEDMPVQRRSLYKVSDTMQAEIIDPSDGQVFDIRTISKPVQMIDDEGYTEWVFYVKPKSEGDFPLSLKVTIIEMKNGVPQSKELIFDETVNIIADGPVPDAAETPFKPAGYTLTYASVSAAGLAITGLKPSVQPGSTGSGAASTQQSVAAPGKSLLVKGASSAGKALLIKGAIALAVASAAVAAAWFGVPREWRDWQWNRLFSDTPESYERFMNEHPAGEHFCAAAFRKAELLNTPRGYREYQNECLDGPNQSQAAAALDRLEKEAADRIAAAPDLGQLQAFLNNFPCSKYLEGLVKVVERDSVLRVQILPVLLQQLQECRQEPSLPSQDVPIPAVPPAGPDQQPAAAGHPERVDSTPAKPPVPAKPSQTDVPAPPETVSPAPKPSGAPGLHGTVLVYGGSFQMGENNDNDGPVHQVTLPSFYIGAKEVSFDEFDLFCKATGKTPPGDEGWGRGRLPVINVSWYDAVAYCNWLSQVDNLTPAYQIKDDTIVTLNAKSNGYRLPTEAEWEFAARGGNLLQNLTYSGSNDVKEVAWYRDNTIDDKTHPTGYKTPNALGLYDMSGNVREWCYDRFTKYTAAAATNPIGAQRARNRILRGGCWNRNPEQLRCTYRNSASPEWRDNNTGFRIARNQ